MDEQITIPEDCLIEDPFFDLKMTLTKTPKKTIALGITRVVVKSSVRAIAVSLVNTYVPADTKAKKLNYAVGTWALTGSIADSAADWACDAVDDYCKIMSAVIGGVKSGTKKVQDEKQTEETEKSTEEVPSK